MLDKGREEGVEHMYFRSWKNTFTYCTVTEILVRGTKIPGKFGLLDYYFQKILVRAWNNGPSANTSVYKHFNDTSLCQSVQYHKA